MLRAADGAHISTLFHIDGNVFQYPEKYQKENLTTGIFKW
jgi:hypothetical protein